MMAIRQKICRTCRTLVLCCVIIIINVDCFHNLSRKRSIRPLFRSLATLPSVVESIEKEIVRLGRTGKTDQALLLFETISKPSIRQINAALDACARACPVRLRNAFQLLEQTPRPNVYTFGALMSACARAAQVEDAIQLLDTMEMKYNVKPNGVVYNTAISSCSNARRPDLAMQLLERARSQGVVLSVVGYNAAVSAAAHAGDLKSATDLLERMNQEDDLPNSDAVTYSTVLMACEKAKEWELVIEHAEKMRQAGYALDALALSTVLHACQQLGLARQAIQYLEDMKSAQDYQRRTAGWQVAGKQRLQGPDAVAYRLAISACARGGAWEEGIRLLDDYCAAYGPGDVVAFTAAINGCEYAGEWKQAFMLLDRMRKSKVEPNEVTFSAVIRACANASGRIVASGKVKVDPNDSTTFPAPYVKALQLLNVLKKDPSVADPNLQVYNGAILAAAEALDVQNAFALVRDLQDQGLQPSIVTYGSLMTACERVGRTDLASQVFRLLRNDGMEPNEIIYGAAISCCRKAGESERGFLLLKKMIKEGLKPNVAVFNTVIMAHAEAKTLSEHDMERMVVAFKILASKQYSAASPNRQTYNILIRALASNKYAREAEAYLSAMKSDGLIPDVDLFTATVSAYERLGQPLQALRLMESMREEGYDFYESSVLNAAFKKAVRLANALGRGLSLQLDTDLPNNVTTSQAQHELFCIDEVAEDSLGSTTF